MSQVIAYPHVLKIGDVRGLSRSFSEWFFFSSNGGLCPSLLKNLKRFPPAKLLGDHKLERPEVDFINWVGSIFLNVGTPQRCSFILLLQPSSFFITTLFQLHRYMNKMSFHLRSSSSLYTAMVQIPINGGSTYARSQVLFKVR